MRKPRVSEQQILSSTFGRLRPIRRVWSAKTRLPMWECACECGTVKSFRLSHLRDGQSRSCGCLNRDSASQRRTHGMRRSAEYRIWTNMKTRCTNANTRSYKDYGARGIAVCDRWNSFENFYADMGARPTGHSLNRVDNDGPYSPENCRWATATEQARNKRTVLLVSLDGIVKPLAEWAEELGLLYKPMHRVLRRGDDLIEWISKQQRKAKAA